MTKNILIICTSHDKLGDTGEATGCWVEEVAAPFFEFKKAGFDVVITSIKGGEVPFDEASLNPPALTSVAEKFLLDDAAMKMVTESRAIAEHDADHFDAVFLPGGHGTCWDFPDNPTLISILSKMYNDGKIVSAVCHGPIGFVNVKDSAGHPIVHGKQVTGFSDAEEHAVGKEKIVPFLLETKLKELGAHYQSKGNWAEFAIRDGHLITGQNPGSSHKTAELVVQALTA